MPASPPKLRRGLLRSRFTRRLLTAATILSLLLCLATLGLWVRSYWGQDYLRYERAMFDAKWILGACHNCGEMQLYVQQGRADAANGWSQSTYGPETTTDWALVSQRVVWFLGFGYLRARSTDHQMYAIVFPHWFLALLFAVLPAVRLRAILRARRRYAAGHCPACGYDLRVQLALSERSESNGRATPERCPECGREVLTTDEHR